MLLIEHFPIIPKACPVFPYIYIYIYLIYSISKDKTFQHSITLALLMNHLGAPLLVEGFPIVTVGAIMSWQIST
jgi:hypothetical protein